MVADAFDVRAWRLCDHRVGQQRALVGGVDARAQAAKAALAHNRQCWRDGLETLDAHGRLTADGERLFAEARRFMAGTI